MVIMVVTNNVTWQHLICDWSYYNKHYSIFIQIFYQLLLVVNFKKNPQKVFDSQNIMDHYFLQPTRSNGSKQTSWSSTYRIDWKNKVDLGVDQGVVHIGLSLDKLLDLPPFPCQRDIFDSIITRCDRSQHAILGYNVSHWHVCYI